MQIRRIAKYHYPPLCYEHTKQKQEDERYGIQSYQSNQ